MRRVGGTVAPEGTRVKHQDESCKMDAEQECSHEAWEERGNGTWLVCTDCGLGWLAERKTKPRPTTFEEQLRIAIGTALIQSGYEDQDPDTGTIDTLEWHRCPDCPREEGPCACSGIPYLSDDIWNKIDVYGHFTAAVKILTQGATKALRAELTATQEMLAEYEAVFGAHWKATMKAIDQWQEEDPARRSLTWPDHKVLIKYLLDELETAHAQIERLNTENLNLWRRERERANED